ncbi:MAG: site-specific integrase [Chthoniobacter sp.]|nr:site-specific integrase [Chthoniobacter sp.]
MTAYVFKRPGARIYSGRYRLAGDQKISQVSLDCTNRQVAERRLGTIVEEKERERAGIIAPKAQRDAAQTPLKEHLEEMIAGKEASKDDMYLCNLKNRVLRLIAECKWEYAKDVSPESFQAWISCQALSAKSLNDYLISVRTLLNWMEKRGRILANPLKPVDLLPANGEKRRPRRALSDEEFAKLLNSSGERRVAYLVGATTGLRFGEMREVERRDILLDEAEPRIVARAATTKNKKEAPQPLHAEVVAQLRTFLSQRNFEPTDKIFAPLFRKRGQFKSDLAAAGVDRVDAKGRVVDFHSLRHTFCTNLQRLGTPQRVLMQLMRHSDRRLSDHIYTDSALLPSAETVQKLTIPSLGLSHIASHDLVPAGQTGAQPVTTAKRANHPPMSINTGFPHDQTFPVTPSHNGGMVRDTGFEPVTPTVSR